MERKRDNVAISRRGLLMVTLLLVLGATWTNVAHGRSLYVIAEITNSFNPLPILAYDIGQDGKLTFQTRQYIPFRDGGAVGIAIDWQSEHLFVTYEYSEFLNVLDARTMVSLGKTGASDASNLAGVVFDESKGMLYCVDYSSSKLHSYIWNAHTGKLTATLGSPFTLEGSTAYGIALDEEQGLLYAANGSKTVRIYSTSDWSSVGTITVSRPAISIAVDTSRNLLYTGGGYIADTMLCQYDMTTGVTKSVQVDSVAGVMGLAVDLVTGCVYTTTGVNNRKGGDDLLVYDTSLTLIDSVLDIGNPTGIVIPARELGYNPLNFAKEIVTDGDVESDEEIYVSPGETVTYRLCFDNTVMVSDVSIVDTLPQYMTFVDADGYGDYGTYNAGSHTFTWSLSSVPAGSGTCLELRAKVKSNVPEGTVLRNYARIQTRTIGPSTTSAEAVVKGGLYAPLELTKQVVGGVQKDDGQAYANAGDAVSYTIQYGNEGNIYSVTDVSIVDTLPEAMTFLSVEGDTGDGAYDAAAHTYTCLLSSLGPDETGNITLTTRINNDAVSGSVITNSVTIDSGETSPTTATADLVVSAVELKPLNLTKEIVEGGSDPYGDGVRYVDIGEDISYLLCYDNIDNERAVDSVSIVDFLPAQMTFVSADGDGEFGRYDAETHTYTWSIRTLEAGEAACVELVAQVKDDTDPGTLILNRATIDSDQTEATMADTGAIVNEIEFNSLGLSKRITAGTISGDDETVTYVGIGDNVTYEICFDNNDNDYRVEGLMLVDTLPAEVTFVTADGDGVFGSYDADKHTYTWSYPSLLPQASACLNLICQVNADTTAGASITNYVTIDSNDTDSQTTSVRAVAEKKEVKPFDLTKTVTAGITGQDDKGTFYVALGGEITYTVCLTNNNDLALSNVLVVDTLPAGVTFVSADGDGEFGRYDPETHTYTWSFPTFEPTAQICLDLTVHVNEDAGPGVTLRNYVRLRADDTSSTADIPVVTEYRPPVLTKTVSMVGDGGKTDERTTSALPGQEIVYTICFENNQTVALHDIVIVDTLPAGTVFVSTDGDSGYYDAASHSYIWTYDTVEPGTVQCLNLTVRLGYDLQPGTVLRNVATLDASETPVTDTNVDVTIEEAPVLATLTLSPLILGREGYNRSDQITALLEFDEDVLESDISANLLQLDPGSVTANSQTVSVVNGKVQIRAYFDLWKVLDAVPVDGVTTLYIGGQFRSGRTFYGEGTVLVVAVRPF